MNSQSIGQIAQTQAEKNQNADGRSAGSHTSVATQTNTSAVAAWLAKHTPADLDKVAVSRAQLHGVTLKVKVEGRYPRGENGERLASYLVATGCEISGSIEQRKAALADLSNFLTPAPIREIEKWIAELSVITAGRGREGFDAELMINAYSARLSKYPADIAKHALLGVIWKWFPSWGELEKICAAKTGPRMHMVKALETPEPEPEQDRRPATKEERDRISKLIAEQFPNAPQASQDRSLDEAASGDCMKASGVS